eukprot:EG_transcript_1168
MARTAIPGLLLAVAVLLHPGGVRGGGAADGCCDFDSEDHPCFTGPDHGDQGCPVNASVCNTGRTQQIGGHEYGTCECTATRFGVAVNKSSPNCCYENTMGKYCEMCTGAPPAGLNRLPAPSNATLCFPPNRCNTSVLSHTDHKAFLCDVKDPYLKELLRAGFPSYSDGTVQASVQCRGDFLRHNTTADSFETLTYECERSQCDCEGCSSIVIAIIGAVHSHMWLQCLPDGTCWFWQQELLGGRHINLSCTGSECLPPGALLPPRLSAPPYNALGYDGEAYCKADFLLWHSKHYTRPVTMDPVLSCSFRSCKKVMTESPPPPPREWMLSFIFVPLFLVILGAVSLAVYFLRLTRRCEHWQKHMSGEEAPPIRVSCKRVSYTVRTPEGTRNVLEPLNCELQSGRALAVMGASGAGKTTFLDIVAGRAKAGNVGGSVRVNGERLRTAQAFHIYRRYICAYVMQEDCLPGYLTARECVRYAAQLRLPLGVTVAEKERRVAGVLAELGLAHVAETRIGSPNDRGVSGGEMKRVSIAMQMVIDPHMLVLDEPTSGLDAYNAHQVMEHLLRAFQHRVSNGVPPPTDGEADDVLAVEADVKAPLCPARSAAPRRPIVVFSIHQPSARIFQLFDQLLLFSRGKVLYHGAAAQAVPYFEGRGYAYSPGTNPADWLLFLSTTTTPMDSPAAGDPTLTTTTITGAACPPAPTETAVAPADAAGPPPCVIEVAVMDRAAGVDDEAPDLPSSAESGGHGRGRRHGKSVLKELQSSMWYYPEFLEQLPVLFWRGIVGMRRNPLLLWAHLIVTTVLALFVGVLYQHLDDCQSQPVGLECQPDLNGIWNRAGGLFFLLAFLALASLSSIDSFQSDRILFIRERASGYYGTAAYLLPKLVLDFFPLRLFPAALLAILIYYKIPLGNGVSFGLGLRAGFEYFTWFITIFCLFNVCASAMCITLSALCPSPGLSALVSTLYILFLMVFGGIYIRMDSMPEGLRWLRYVSFFSSAFELLMVNEINGRTVLFNPVDVDGNHMYNVPQTGYLMLRNMGLVPTEAQWKLDASMLLFWTVAYIVLACLFLQRLRERR